MNQMSPRGLPANKARKYTRESVMRDPRVDSCPTCAKWRCNDAGDTTLGNNMAVAMGYEHLTVERPAEQIALVTFNRPARANALHYAHIAEIEDVALSFRDDADTRVVIFTGTGKHFSSGADLKEIGGDSEAPFGLR